jgi:hypothetical protein
MNAKAVLRPFRLLTTPVFFALIGCCLTASTLAQNTIRDLPPGSTSHAAPVDWVTPLAADTTFAEEASTIPEPPEVVEAAAVPVENVITLPAYAAPVFSAYIAPPDTNAAIGIFYPSGSIDFVHLFAGKPRPTDPRLPPSLRPPEPVAAIEVAPLVTYEMAGGGSRAVMFRRSDATFIRDFPAGATLRGSTMAPGGSPSSAGAARNLEPEPERTETGEILVRTFPPGATVRRTAGAVP